MAIRRKKLTAAAMFVPERAWVWGRCMNRGTVPVSAAVLAWQQKEAGCVGPSDTVPTPLCLWKRHFIVPSRHYGTKPQEPTQLEMVGSIHTECLACSGTFLPSYVSQETTSYFLSCLWHETSTLLLYIVSIKSFLDGGIARGDFWLKIPKFISPWLHVSDFLLLPLEK